MQQVFNPRDQLLGLKRLANEFIRLHGHGLFGDRLVHDAGHQDDGSAAETLVLLDPAADGVTVLIGHDDVGDDRIRRILLEQRQPLARPGCRRGAIAVLS